MVKAGERGKGNNLSRSELSNIIDEWILNERNRNILKRRLLDGVTYDRLADEFSLSDRQVKTIVYKGQETIFKHLPIS